MKVTEFVMQLSTNII